MYRLKDDELLIEGDLITKEETLPSRFRFVLNRENGYDVDFVANLGAKTIDVEAKAIKNQIRLYNSYCKVKNECVHSEVDVKFVANRKCAVSCFTFKFTLI